MEEKKIEFSAHAKYNMERRGATEEEIKKAINSRDWITAKRGRFECEKEFPYNREWNGKFYEHKKVRPVLIEEEHIVVITVYTFYY